jgi:hypothetical protein
MATFGNDVAARAWPILAAHQGLTAATVTTYGPPTINLTTGVVTRTSTSATYDALLGQFARREVDGAWISSTDHRSVYLRQAEVSTSPSLADTVTIGGIAWEVLGVGLASNGGLWKLEVRRIGDMA